MIFKYYNALFLHSGRTGGTSIELALSPSLLSQFPLSNARGDRELLFGWDVELKIYLQHASAQTACELLGENFTKYFKFSVVRNPFSRLRSVYAYQFDGFQKRYGNFRNFILALPELLTRNNNAAGSHFIPQVCFTHLNGQNICSRILRFESLDADYHALKTELGIKGGLPKINSSAYPTSIAGRLTDIYDNEMVDMMNQIYCDDFSEFAYPTEPPA